MGEGRADRGPRHYVAPRTGRALVIFFARQIKDKTGSGATRKKALSSSARTSRRTSISYQPRWTRTPLTLFKEWFDDRDLATDLHLSLNKNRLASMGSNFCDHTKLGFKDAAALRSLERASLTPCV
jgi:hypothetical protein